MAEILIVEDAAPIAELVADHLSDRGHVVHVVPDGETALAELGERTPALVVLDVMLPGRSGYDVCRWLRARPGPQPVVVMLTAKRDEVDALGGYDAGADDYVRKPFSVRELVRRIESLLALRGRTESVNELKLGELVLDGAARRALVRGVAIVFTPLEFDLLWRLARSAGHVLERELLLRDVWGYEHAGYARTVDSHVTRLRKKLTQAGLADPIRTVHGVGYCFDTGDRAVE
jgi:DNA-binding response OmpR family regulator